MAARYATLTLRAGWSWNDSIRAQQTEQLQLRLAGFTYTYQRGGGATQYVVPDPDDLSTQREFVLQGVKNLVSLIRATIQAKGLFYTVSDPRDVGDDATHGGYDNGNNAAWPLVEFDITASVYDPAYDLLFSNPSVYQGWTVVASQTTIKPVLVFESEHTNATIYGSATGHVVVSADGNASPYTWQWSDGATGFERSQLKAGTYLGTVTDGWGESAQLTVVITSDARLEVQVNAGADSVELVPRGGVPPYAFAWLDGPTDARRTGLPDGRYHCVVSDAHGASRDVEVVIARSTRYWFSGNPITLPLVATAPDTVAFGCEVYVEPVYLSGDFVLAGQALEQPVDATGATVFEVQELLEPYVAPPLPPLLGASPAPVRQEGLFRRFFLKHYERSATGAGLATTVQTNYLVHGGLGFEQAATGAWFAGYQANHRPFLTWEPAAKKVLPDQPEYLYFQLLEEAVASFSVQLRLLLADGSTSLQAAASGPAAVRNEIFCLPAGPLQLGLAALEAAAGQLTRAYELTVLGPGGQALSETRRFTLDRRPCPARRYFLYANSLGGWNTLLCRGRATRELATKTSAADNALPAGYDPLRGASTINRRTGLTTLKGYTGPRSAAQLLADQDFLLSERVLLLEQGRYLAGQVKDKTVTVSDEDATRRVVQFDYELPRERYYTPLLTP